jgi:hypothetical protein
MFSTGIIATLANPISHNLLLTPLLSLLCPTNANAYLAALRCLSPIAVPASRSILLKQMSVFEPGTGDRKKAPLRIRRSDGRKANNGTIRTNKRVLSVAKRVVLKTATVPAALLLIRRVECEHMAKNMLTNHNLAFRIRQLALQELQELQFRFSSWIGFMCQIQSSPIQIKH